MRGKPAFAAPTVSSVVLCSSAAIPTFTEIPGAAGRTVWAARGCQWVYASIGRKAKDTITQGIIINRVSDGAINVSGTHLRDLPIPRRVLWLFGGTREAAETEGASITNAERPVRIDTVSTSPTSVKPR